MCTRMTSDTALGLMGVHTIWRLPRYVFAFYHSQAKCVESAPQGYAGELSTQNLKIFSFLNCVCFSHGCDSSFVHSRVPAGAQCERYEAPGADRFIYFCVSDEYPDQRIAYRFIYDFDSMDYVYDFAEYRETVELECFFFLSMVHCASCEAGAVVQHYSVPAVCSERGTVSALHGNELYIFSGFSIFGRCFESPHYYDEDDFDSCCIHVHHHRRILPPDVLFSEISLELVKFVFGIFEALGHSVHIFSPVFDVLAIAVGYRQKQGSPPLALQVRGGRCRAGYSGQTITSTRFRTTIQNSSSSPGFRDYCEGGLREICADLDSCSFLNLFYFNSGSCICSSDADFQCITLPEMRSHPSSFTFEEMLVHSPLFLGRGRKDHGCALPPCPIGEKQ